MACVLTALLAGWVAPEAVPALQVEGLALDSREVTPGQVFLAFQGHREHGLAHAGQAAAAGAVAILYEPAGWASPLPEPGIPLLPLPGLAALAGAIADRFHQHPSSALSVVAVTGTNGKTTTTHFIAQALGAEAGVVGTLGWGRSAALQPTRNTTPSALQLQGYLAALRDAGCHVAAIEASSHGLCEHRLAACRVRVAVLTNFTRDHLDYHGTFEAYVAAKLSLLDQPGLETMVWNHDDPLCRAKLAQGYGTLRSLPYSLKGEGDAAVLRATSLEMAEAGVRMTVVMGEAQALLQAPVVGWCNAENALAACAVLLALGYPLADAVQRLAHLRPVAGRMQSLLVQGVTAVIDYAHTPDALERVLADLRRVSRGRLVAVLGCGGNRDPGKRPAMGRIATLGADHVVLTDDNPRHEDPAAIIADMLAGCSAEASLEVIHDRREAIAAALKRCQPGDLLLVAGKGHETTQEKAGVFYPHSDLETLMNLTQN
ncbi:MAG: UDP-N-acetylmuramoylalanyl-D-glutamate--2,6-diaminopimelate ligase [Pseudomonadota bacterium]|jgi:UDP-N-acetylmuramoyl-L-alanyl-D-glutamate--2,6-diaminopimelate ligase